MAFTPKTDWKPGDEYPAERVVEFEAQIAANEAALADKADKSAIPTVPAAPTADTLSGATAVGKSVIKAADKAAARAAIDAGTSSLPLGTTATTALKGDTVIPAATEAGTAAQLTAGTDTVVRAFTAKDISDFVTAKITELAEPKAG